MSGNLSLIMYGGERDGVHNVFYLAVKARLPEITNCCYVFHDKHTEANDWSSDSMLLSRESINFTLAVYDADTHLFYSFEYDT